MAARWRQINLLFPSVMKNPLARFFCSTGESASHISLRMWTCPCWLASWTAVLPERVFIEKTSSIDKLSESLICFIASISPSQMYDSFLFVWAAKCNGRSPLLSAACINFVLLLEESLVTIVLKRVDATRCLAHMCRIFSCSTAPIVVRSACGSLFES